jgi:hypothetical protein
MKAVLAGSAWFALFLIVSLVAELFADPSPKPGFVGPWSGVETEWGERPR